LPTLLFSFCVFILLLCKRFKDKVLICDRKFLVCQLDRNFKNTMMETVETQIINLEERLRQAMLASDVRVLNELVAPKVIITSHQGDLLSKQDDLTAHQSGLFKIKELNPSERQIQIYREVAIVSVRMEVSGWYNGEPANGDFRYTRVWAISSTGTWQIVAAHIGKVV
jgi:ketosteroid isomerase-like protein